MNKNVEIWKDIPSYEGLYQVSNLGRVKSLPKEWVNGIGKIISHNGKILKTGVSRGYKSVCLCCDAIQKTYKVHQLVAIAFLNHKPCGMKLVIDHVNDNKLDNRVENLQIVTNRFNCFKTQGKDTSRYKGVSWDKYNNKWVSKIRINGRSKFLGRFKCELAASYAYQKALNEYNKHQSTIC